ncbi:hypothetical protein ACHAXA_003627 [Cyclostephanos tholiformis]|uniref:Uncharacterized protein n=1 Tax=Cyclostephanos tholiformis TaxID=382380 RepID=A0ABD3SQK5_9STRA
MIVGPSMEDQISLSRCRASHSKRSAPLQPIAPCPAFRVPYTPNPSLRGIFAGTASKTMSIVGPAVIALTRRPPRDLSLLYIGTASYDISENRYRQTHEFIKMGVTVKSLDVANQFVHRHEMEEAVNEADIILVSGGNTLYAVDRWERLGLADLLREAAFRGTVIAGGSAGAICWFDGGHSDSMDPSTHRLFKLKTSSENESDDSIKSFHLTRVVSLETNMEMDVESDREMDEDSSANDWEYIRVKGSMMERHPYEVGIGIDNFAALEFDGPNFRVLSMLGVTSPKIKDEVDKVPGVWINYVDGDGTSHAVIKITPRKAEPHDYSREITMICNVSRGPVVRAIGGKSFGSSSSSSSSFFVTAKARGGIADAETRRPRAVVLVLGFGGAEPRHVEKYARLYNRKGCSTVSGTASNRSIFVDRAGIDDVATDAIRAVARLLRDDDAAYPTIPPDTATPVVMHIMSNGGAFVASRIGQMLASPIDSNPCARGDLELFCTRLGGGCQIFDSAPCYIDRKSCFNVIKNLIPNPFVGIPMAILFTLRMYVHAALSRMTGRPTFGESFWNALIEDGACNTQAFIYSCKDDIADSTKIEEFARERRARGVKVLSKRFSDSSHVQHLRLHGEDYSDFIDAVLTEIERGGRREDIAI